MMIKGSCVCDNIQANYFFYELESNTMHILLILFILAAAKSQHYFPHDGTIKKKLITIRVAGKSKYIVWHVLVVSLV